MINSSEKKNVKPATGYWKSLNEFNGEPVVEAAKLNEFAEGVTDKFDLKTQSLLSRRKFLALAGATTAFTATACTNYRDEGEIIPYNKKPDNILPGKANYYASTCNACSLSCGILIKTREGRPVKIDGNPDHPVNKGKICSAGQANVMNLYDPDRLRFPGKINSGGLTLKKDNLDKDSWVNLDKEIFQALNEASTKGQEIALFSGKIESPAYISVIEKFKTKYPTSRLYSYELMNTSKRDAAWKSCYGDSPFPLINWEDANIIVSLEADFLAGEGNFVENIRKFVSRRNVDKLNEFGRLYVAEAGMSLTGMNSDYRLRIKPEMQFDLAMTIASEIVKSIGNFSLDPITLSKLSNYSSVKFAKENGIDYKTLNLLIGDLLKNRGKSIVYAGNILPENVHTTVNLINEILGNTALYNKETSTVNLVNNSDYDEIGQLVGRMISGKVAVIIHLDTNPVYSLPDDLGYVPALKNVGTRILLSQYLTETAEYCQYILPIHHNFESWGDFKPRTGVLSLAQPVISPIYDTRQKEAIILNWCGDSPIGFDEGLYHKYLMNFWETSIYPALGPVTDFKTFWYSALHDGVVTFKEAAIQFPALNKNITDKLEKNIKSDGLTLVLVNNIKTFSNGSFANNGWLQEMPHPVTKITWDNVALLSPSTAKDLGVETEDIIQINTKDNSVKLPVWVQPGLADKVIAAELGYGRWAAGEVGNNVGFNTNKFIKAKTGTSEFIITGVRVSKIDGKYKLASTQEHHSIDDKFFKDQAQKRKIIREATVEEYKKNSNIIAETREGNLSSITPGFEYKDLKWAMAIDMNKCVGCGLCISACNVENNIAIVGKDQVLNGREMQWMRIDRYYTGTPEEPEVSNQPMLCQQCDNAPCENVCPVAATNHSPDGLNQMVYNRCVGTRYCSNNCPFKVRRYNFFDFRDHFSDSYQYKDSFKLLANPEVTVRSRGVMEKCTFCVQRIMEARQDATMEGRQLKGTDVKTACQVACPAEAIVFGSSNDKDSEIVRQREHKLGYFVLEDLNVKPNVTYIARLRNKNSEEA